MRGPFLSKSLQLACAALALVIVFSVNTAFGGPGSEPLSPDALADQHALAVALTQLPGLTIESPLQVL